MIDYKLQMYSDSATEEPRLTKCEGTADVSVRRPIAETLQQNTALLDECLQILTAIRESLLAENVPPYKIGEIKSMAQNAEENNEAIKHIQNMLIDLRAILGA